MVHQCVSEDIWFRAMLDIDVGAPPLPKDETRLEFMRQYAQDSGKRLAVLREKDEAWWVLHCDSDLRRPNRFQECLILEPIFISFRGPEAPDDRLFNPVERWPG